VALSSYWHLLRDNRNYRLLWMAQIVSELGDWFYTVAVFTFILALTGSAQLVSIAFVCQVLPVCIAGPAAGVINDRLNRKSVMIFADWARAAIVFSMLFVKSKATLPLLFVLLFLESVCWAMFEPGSRAVLPNITTKEQMPVANALSSATWSTNFALGAGIGGLAAVWLGRDAVFVLNALSFVASALLLSRMRFAEPHAENRPPLKPRDLFDFTEIVEGARYIRRNPKVLTTIFVKGGGAIMGTNWVILPVLGERVFPIHLHGLTSDQAGTLGMSTLLASRGIGAIFGAYVGGNVAGTNVHRIRWIVTIAFLMGAVGYLALGFAGSLVAAALTIMLAHAGGSAAWTSSSTLLQQQTDDKFRGRVFSTEFAFTMLMLSIASFAAGRLADSGVPVRTLATWTGMAMFIPAVAWIVASRSWRNAPGSS
jgi:MFS family permease